MDSVTTRITTAGRKNSVTRPTVTFTAPMEDVTYPTITALTSLTEHATSTLPVCTTAVHADCLMVLCTLAHATTMRTARNHCS